MGTVEAYTSPALPSMQESDVFGPLSASTQGQIASFALLAALLSGPPIGFLVDKIGRKTILMILALPFITGWVLIAAAFNLPMLYIGRLLTGFCDGVASLVVPIYVGEIADAKFRGMLSSGFQLMVTMGNCFVYILGSFMDWQWLAIFCAVFPLVGLILMIFVPPSPRYLLSKEKKVEATAALMWLRGADYSEEIETELRSIELNLTMSTKKKGTFGDIFKLQTTKPLGICLLILFFQQLTGIQGILMYPVHIFRKAGSDWDPNVCTIVIGSLQVLATLFSATLVDKLGEGNYSELGSLLSITTLAFFFYFKELDPSVVDRFGWIPLLSLVTFIFFFAVGIGPVPFLMIAELNSVLVEIASAICTNFNGLLPT